jgi:uncharacterized protein (TIGR03067 family)
VISDMPTDLETLQGTWNVTSLETDGQKMPATAFNGARIVIDGNKFASLGMGATYKGAVKLDPDSKPKAFDLLFTAGHAKGHRNLGIYKLAGDKWTICLATRGNQRPGKFATAPGTGFALETLERGEVTRKSGKQKSQRARARGVSSTTTTAQHETAASGPVTELEGEWAMVSAVLNGVAMNQLMVKWCQRITHGNVTRVVAGPQVFVNASFTLNNSKKPQVINYLNLEGASKGESQAGIFELIGDSLKICMSAPGQPRPADFSSKPGDGRSYTTWRLVKR